MNELTIAGALLIGLGAFLAAYEISGRYFSSSIMAIQDFYGEDASRSAKVGNAVGNAVAKQMARLGGTKAQDKITDWLRWAQRSGYYRSYSTQRVLMNSALLGILGLPLALLSGSALGIIVPVALVAIPLVILYARAKDAIKQAVASIPSLSMLVASEMSSTSNPDKVLLTAQDWISGPLSALIKEAYLFRQSAQHPLFGRGIPGDESYVKGALKIVFDATGVRELTLFSTQLECVVARTGEESGPAMRAVAESVEQEDAAKRMAHAEKLENYLTGVVGLFFFGPLMMSIFWLLMSSTGYR